MHLRQVHLLGMLLLVLMTAAVSRSATVTFYPGSLPVAWVAFRNADGAWTKLTAQQTTAGDTFYAGTATGRYSLAYVYSFDYVTWIDTTYYDAPSLHNAGNPLITGTEDLFTVGPPDQMLYPMYGENRLHILNATVAERPVVDYRVDEAIVDPGEMKFYNLSGSFSNLPTGWKVKEYGFISSLGFDTETTIGSTYSLVDVPAMEGTLFAIAVSATGTQAKIYRKTLNVIGNMTQNISFTAPEVQSYNLVKPYDLLDAMHGTSLTLLAPGLFLSLADSQATTTKCLVPDVTASTLATGGKYLATDYSAEVTNGTLSLLYTGQVVDNYFTRATFTHTLTPARTNNTTTNDSVTWTPSADDALYLLTTGKVEVSMTRGWLSNTTAPVTYTLPNLSTVSGWNAQWGLNVRTADIIEMASTSSLREAEFGLSGSSTTEQAGIEHVVVFSGFWSRLSSNEYNTKPTASNATVSVTKNVAKDITLRGNDADGGDVTYFIATKPAHGTLRGAAPYLTYTPAPNYVGPDSFTFFVSDGYDDSTVGTITINVAGGSNSAPVAANKSVVGLKNTAKGVVLSATDADSDPLTYSIVGAPSHGTVTVRGYIATYTPATNWVGTDSFTYKAYDGTAYSNVATVTMTTKQTSVAPTSVTLATSPVSPQAPNTTITLTATQTGGKEVEYKFQRIFGGVVTDLTTGYQTGTTCTWKPTQAGTYTLRVWARAQGATVAYQKYAAKSFVVAAPAPPITAVTLTASPASPTLVNTPITLTATATGGRTVEYKFRQNFNGTVTDLTTVYNTTRTLTWTPTVAGRYTLIVWARERGATAPYQAVRSLSYTVAAPLSAVKLSASLPTGTSGVTLTATPTGGAVVEYRFRVINGGVATDLTGYVTNPVCSWTPPAAGPYILVVWAREKGSTAAYQAVGSMSYTVE